MERFGLHDWRRFCHVFLVQKRVTFTYEVPEGVGVSEKYFMGIILGPNDGNEKSLVRIASVVFAVGSPTLFWGSIVESQDHGNRRELKSPRAKN